MPQPMRLTETERANLVALLDRELSEADAQQLEAKIARSVSARKEVDALEKTWGMLDWLPRLEAPEDFANQTVSLIRSRQMRAERIEGRVRAAAGMAARGTAAVGSIALAALVGFLVVRFAWPDPTRQLAQDLDIVENLDAYRSIPDLGFLEDLSRLGLFSERPAAAGAAPPAAGEGSKDASEMETERPADSS